MLLLTTYICFCFIAHMLSMFLWQKLSLNVPQQPTFFIYNLLVVITIFFGAYAFVGICYWISWTKHFSFFALLILPMSALFPQNRNHLSEKNICNQDCSIVRFNIHYGQSSSVLYLSKRPIQCGGEKSFKYLWSNF